MLLVKVERIKLIAKFQTSKASIKSWSVSRKWNSANYDLEDQGWVGCQSIMVGTNCLRPDCIQIKNHEVQFSQMQI